jgi:hypothetical protein
VVGLPLTAARAVLSSWKRALLHPERIRGGEFTEGFMVLFSFFLGFAYNALHYYVYPGCAFSESRGVYDFSPNLQFWLHHLSGGAGAVTLFYYSSVLGYYGTNLLGRRVSYDRVQHAVFSSMFLYLLPLPPAFLLQALNLKSWIYLELQGEWVGIPLGVLLAGLLGMVMAFRILRSFGLGRPSSLLLSLLLLPLLYFGGKGAFLFLTRQALHTSRPLRYALWTLYFTSFALLFRTAGSRRRKVLPVLRGMLG